MNVKTIFDRYKVVIKDDKCYDPIRQIFVRATPEEIVRQKTLKFLMKRLEIPQEKIIVEKALSSLGVSGSRKRIDIGILDNSNLITGIVECKASLLKIDEAAHAQAEDYLRRLNIRYFFVTDGNSFFGYYYDTIQFVRLEEMPKYDQWKSVQDSACNIEPELMFGQRFKELREKKGQTQAAMDEYLDLMRGTVSNWENGFAHPEEELLDDIASYFGVSISYLLGKDVPEIKKAP